MLLNNQNSKHLINDFCLQQKKIRDVKSSQSRQVTKRFFPCGIRRISSDESGFRVSNDLVRAIKNFPARANLTDPRSWLGLANQVGSSTQNLSELSAPLRPLLKKSNEFQWTSDHQATFERKREHLSRPPYLAHYNQERQTVHASHVSKTLDSSQCKSKRW